MQITDQIHALKIPFFVAGPAGGRIARYVYCYLICGREICLIDSGVAGCEKIISDYCKEIGRKPQEISRLILTHSHPDHIGSAAAIQRLTGCTVLAHDAEKAWIEDVALQERQRPVPGFDSLVGGPVKVDRTVEDGEVLRLDEDGTAEAGIAGADEIDRKDDATDRGMALQVLHTPGHSKGSISLWMAKEGALFSADAIAIPADMPIYQDFSASIQSIRRLSALPEIKFLLAAWDGPRRGGEAYDIMHQSLQYLDSINRSVLFEAEANPGRSCQQICLAVISRLKLPQFMANPLTRASFLASLKARIEEEERIVWLKDRESLAKMGYVREKWQETVIRTGPARAPPEETLIGYATLKKTAEKTGEKGFHRRIFTLKPIDRFFDPEGDFRDSMPPEGVDPLDIAAGKPGRRIE